MGASRAQRAATAERRARAIKLRMAGATWDMVKEQCGYSDKGAACKDVSRALEQNLAMQQESAEQLRNAEVERLNRLQLGLWGPATGGDYRAANVVRQIIADRSRLQGLEVPPDVEERITRETMGRLSSNVGNVFAMVFDGLGLTDAQRALVPGLMRQAVAALDPGTPSRTIEGSVAA